MVVKTTRIAALAAAYRVDPDRWSDGGALLDRIAPRFARYEPLRRAGSLMIGLLSGLDRKNCWTIAEQRGDGTPDGLQHLLSRAKWDADAVRDDLRGYVADSISGLIVASAALFQSSPNSAGTGTCSARPAWSIRQCRTSCRSRHGAPERVTSRKPG